MIGRGGTKNEDGELGTDGQRALILRRRKLLLAANCMKLAITLFEKEDLNLGVNNHANNVFGKSVRLTP